VSPWSIGGGVSGVLLHLLIHQWRHPYHMTLCRLWIQLVVKMLTPGVLTLANLCERLVLFTNAHCNLLLTLLENFRYCSNAANLAGSGDFHHLGLGMLSSCNYCTCLSGKARMAIGTHLQKVSDLYSDF
jgi:hypothetical protein